jgi:hypothetical protein
MGETPRQPRSLSSKVSTMTWFPSPVIVIHAMKLYRTKCFINHGLFCNKITLAPPFHRHSNLNFTDPGSSFLASLPHQGGFGHVLSCLELPLGTSDPHLLPQQLQRLDQALELPSPSFVIVASLLLLWLPCQQFFESAVGPSPIC